MDLVVRYRVICGLADTTSQNNERYCKPVNIAHRSRTY
jgi:hypothetical protein